MKHLASAPQDGSLGGLLRSFRYRAYLSQEQLAERAELSERTVRSLEADQVRSPRNDTVRLLADALELTERERESWFAAARGENGHQARPGLPVPVGSARFHVTVGVLTGAAQDASDLAITCLLDPAGEIVLVVHCTHGDASPTPEGRLTLPAVGNGMRTPKTTTTRVVIHVHQAAGKPELGSVPGSRPS